MCIRDSTTEAESTSDSNGADDEAVQLAEPQVETEAPPTADVPPQRTQRPRDRFRGQSRRDRHQPAITDLLSEGQEILVQIAKEPIAKKGARITSHIALPGRFLVYLS